MTDAKTAVFLSILIAACALGLGIILQPHPTPSQPLAVAGLKLCYAPQTNMTGHVWIVFYLNGNQPYGVTNATNLHVRFWVCGTNASVPIIYSSLLK